MQSKARMTFRFEPTKPPQPIKPVTLPIKVDRRSTIEPTKSLEQSWEKEDLIESSFTSWDSPFQDDIHALEEVIRKSEIIAEQPSSFIPVLPDASINIKKVEESIYAPFPAIEGNSYSEFKKSWSGPLIEQEEESQIEWMNQAKTVRDTPTWGRVFISVTAAVATGALFGYLVLSLFTGEPLFPGKSDLTVQGPVQASSGSNETSSAVPQTINNNGDKAVQQIGQGDLTNIEADVYYMLQYGVFQSEESMQAAVQQLQKMGLDSTIESQEGYRVYLGAALTRAEAELLAAQFKGVEIYIRPLEGELLSIRSGTLPEGTAEFMTASTELIRLLIQFSGIYLQDNLPQAMSDSELAVLEEAHRNWLSKSVVVDTLNDEFLNEGKRIVQALNSAALSLTDYESKPSRFHLWSIQSQAMSAMIADRNLRTIVQSVNK